MAAYAVYYGTRLIHHFLILSGMFDLFFINMSLHFNTLLLGRGLGNRYALQAEYQTQKYA